MQRDLAAFMARGLILSYIYTGQIQHRYNYAGQMEDAFPELRRYPNAEVRYLSWRITPSRRQPCVLSSLTSW